MSVDVSVIVPFFNPGANIDDCLMSLIDQTLDAKRFETILVDDGSTDGSDARVEEWADRHPGRFIVRRIAASGGPARPRNVGIDMARGRYIQFLDSDDTLPPASLERQLAVADASAADVVVGKLASDFRGIWHPLFRETVTGKTLATYPLIQNVTVCKMFRRDFLAEHNVRFPEGPHYIEDQQICIQAYAHACSVAVVADTICYQYRRRRVAGRHFGDTTIEPAAYFHELAAIFDVIDTEVEPAARDASLARYYRGEMLGRLRGPAMLGYDEGYRQTMYDEVRRLAIDRIPARVHDDLPVFPRLQSRLLLDGDLDGLVGLARWMETFRLAATGTVAGWRDGRLLIDVDAELRHDDTPLRLETDGDDWLLPESVAPGTDTATRRLDDLVTADVDLATIARVDSQLWSTTSGLSLTVDQAGVPRVRCRAEIDPDHVMGGTRLTPGLWDFRLRVMVGGLTRSSSLRATGDDPPRPKAWLSGATASVQAYWTDPSPTLALDVDEWMHRLVERAVDAVGRIEGRRRLVVDLPELIGAATSTRAATILLEPLDASEPLIDCAAELRVGPEGSTIEAALPSLSGDVNMWGAWLRLGDAGSGPPIRLELTLRPGRLGRVLLGVPIAPGA
jgi:glycosyltransferase involved in cell wall biosynthesis